MKSFCIKTNNNKIISYLLNRFENIYLDNIYISNRKFKIYSNIIVHYTGENFSLFINNFCDILTDCIINFYEYENFKKIINMNYFYFSEIDRNNILNNCNDFLKEDTIEKEIKKEHIYVSLLKYIDENKYFVLDGFVNFRLSKYIKVLDNIVDSAVNDFLIEREYNEFISLLKLYIDSKKSSNETIHLIYMNNESILLDNNKNVISIDDNILDAKYLSDITFSSNDYALNTLLKILPEKILLHIIDEEDEFINTLKLIFENNINTCNHCSICTAYKMIKQKVQR